MLDFFEDDEYYTGGKCDSQMLLLAEKKVGYCLPSQYKELLMHRNGGSLRKGCVGTSRPTSWAQDHIKIEGIFGVGEYDWGIDSEFGSKYLIKEWRYPKIGVVFCDTPSSGPDCVMLDYRRSGKKGEPQVVYVDEDRSILRIAENFSEFIANLKDCGCFES